MSIGEKLKKLRDDQNWSQDTLAKMIKIDRSTISRYETGKGIPSKETLLQYAKIFKVDKDYLLNSLEPQQPDAAESGFVTKETLEDPDFDMIFGLLEVEQELKKSLVQLSLMAPKRRSFFADAISHLIKVEKWHKDKM